MSESSISTNYQYLNNYLEKDMYYAAEACLAEAIIRTEKDDTFTNTTLAVDDDASCTVNISSVGGSKQIDISVSSGSYVQNFQAQATVDELGEIDNLTLSSWQEI